MPITDSDYQTSYGYHWHNGDNGKPKGSGWVVIQETIDRETGNVIDTEEAPRPCFFKRERDAERRVRELMEEL